MEDLESQQTFPEKQLSKDEKTANEYPKFGNTGVDSELTTRERVDFLCRSDTAVDRDQIIAELKKDDEQKQFREASRLEDRIGNLPPGLKGRIEKTLHEYEEVCFRTGTTIKKLEFGIRYEDPVYDYAPMIEAYFHELNPDLKVNVYNTNDLREKIEAPRSTEIGRKIRRMTQSWNT